MAGDDESRELIREMVVDGRAESGERRVKS
jgi:hypothetical protein